MISLEAKFNQIVEALQKSAKYDEFKKQFTNFAEASMEVKINAGLAVLKRAGIIESINESGWGMTFESRPTTRKHNGASDNGHGAPITEADRTIAKKEELVESVGTALACSEAEARMFLGLPPKNPKGYEALSETQQREFDCWRASGVSESECFDMVKMPLVDRGW